MPRPAFSEVLCSSCLTPFTPDRKNRRFCCRQCGRDDITEKNCKACGVLFRGKKSNSVCSEACRKATRKGVPAAKYTCRCCGVEFSRKRYASGAYSRQTKYCTRECAFEHLASKGRAKRGQAKLDDGISGDTHRRRCRRYGVPCEHINKTKVYQRDKWTCQLCGVRMLDEFSRVDGTVNPLSPTLDHIIPLSLGPGVSPGHVWGNVQAACWGCNVRKGADPNFKCD